MTAPRVDLEGPLRTRTILTLVAKLGVMTPDQIASSLCRQPISRITTGTLRRISDRVSRMTRSGLLKTTTLPTTITCLRSDRTEYRLTPMGEYEAANTNSVPTRRALVAIAKLSSGRTGWAGEDAVWTEAYPGYSDRHAVRHRLKKYHDEGLVEINAYPSPHVTHAISIRRGAFKKLNRALARRGTAPLDLVRVPRVDQTGHHLMTVQAALLILNSTDGTLVRFQGDEDLRSKSRKGRRIRAGTRDDSYPDGRMTFRDRDGTERRSDIEILTSKYTDQVICKKHEGLEAGTIFAAPTARLADRVETLTGRRPLILTP